ncbi:penicillin-binding protein 2 [Patescibacteria group bacterium]|nr:penicillin-binding protein 2 [Patescibacteria group bacterium]MBU1705332.1 penicillin-binding protein 2 [Patescibacteria group bacterium]
MFGLKKKTSANSNIFGLQQNQHANWRLPGQANKTLEDLIGEDTRQENIGGRRFLGLTIAPGRFQAAGIIGLCVFFLLFARAAHLQILQGDYYQDLSVNNRIRTTTIVPNRGKITDRHGVSLAENVPSFVLNMTIADLPKDKPERDSVIAKIVDLAGLQPADVDLLITQYAKTSNEPVSVKKGISYETAMRLAIETADLPGFTLETDRLRLYNSSASSLSHILGYVGKISPEELTEFADQSYRLVDEIGKTGLERSAEEYLRGRPGKYEVEVDALGRELSVIAREEPVPGANLILSLDVNLQRMIEEELYGIFNQTQTSRASVVVMDPQSGGLRALVSLPSFDSNSFATGIDSETYQNLLANPDKPLFSRSISGEYPSGSIFKPFVAYAALAEGIITEKTSFLSTGGIAIGPWFFPDWRAGGHGITDVRKALADSVNTFFYIVGGGYQNVTGLGVKRITDYARTFGFGAITGIILPSEADGFLPSKEWKEEVKGERWYVGDTYNLSIGQGDLLVTPLQMAAAMAVIANGGHKVAPRLIEAVDGQVDARDLLRVVASDEEFDPYLIKVVQEGMRRGVTLGSSRYLSLLDMNVAGKTGTAQNIGDRPTHAWWVGFGPYEDPEIVVVILIEEGGEGSEVAVPLAYKIFDWWDNNR